jgi:hypothetical protein
MRFTHLFVGFCCATTLGGTVQAAPISTVSNSQIAYYDDEYSEYYDEGRGEPPYGQQQYYRNYREYSDEDDEYQYRRQQYGYAHHNPHRLQNNYAHRYAEARRSHSRVPSITALRGGHTVVFSPRGNYWAAYNENGHLVRSGRASGGKSYCPDIHRGCRTPVGTYRVYSKGGPGCISKKFPVGRGGAPMPYCMFFHGGYALHGSYEVPNYNASHGCIRVVPSDARWLNQSFVSTGTRIIVNSY